MPFKCWKCIEIERCKRNYKTCMAKYMYITTCVFIGLPYMNIQAYNLCKLHKNKAISEQIYRTNENIVCIENPYYALELIQNMCECIVVFMCLFFVSSS